MQIRQINLSVVVDVHGNFNVHVCCWLDVAYWGVVRMSVHYPDADRDVVRIIFVGDWDGSGEIQQLLASSIVEYIILQSKCQSLVLVQRISDVLFGRSCIFILIFLKYKEKF